MKKILIVITILFVFLQINGFAHTGLKDSNPKKDAVITTPLNEILLTFETKVEIGSSFELKTNNDDIVKPGNITIEENQLKGIFQEPLINGAYIIVWNIIGADGHPIKGEIPFEVNVPEAEQPKSDSEEGKGSEEINNTEEESKSDEQPVSSEDSTSKEEPVLSEQSSVENEDESNDQTEDDPNSSVILFNIIGICVIVLVLLLWRMRRNK